jgi:hypothetical protein
LKAQGPPDAAPKSGGTRPSSRVAAARTCAFSLESFQLTLTKTVQLPLPLIRDSVKSRGFQFCHSPPDTVTFFGSFVRPAPLQVTVSNGLVRNRRQFESFLRNAPVGTSIVLQVSCSFGAIINAMPRSRSAAQ